MSDGKLVSLAHAAALVADGDHITIGGVMLHRIPAAFVRELARQGRRGLRLSKPSPSYDLDLLCAAGCLAEVDAGVASFESAFGGALPGYRRAVETGLVRVREFSCVGVMTGLRAASLGVPFEPVPGFVGTDLPDTADFRTVKDPWTGTEIYVVPALRPRWAILHVQESDVRGNARIFGSPGYDILMAQAADRVILTAERIVASSELAKLPELTVISDLAVAAVVEMPGGARPGDCSGCYEVDDAGVQRYLDASRSLDGLRAYLESVL